ncbi:MAG: hypothetical protein ABGY10_03895 [bacterium]
MPNLELNFIMSVICQNLPAVSNKTLLSIADQLEPLDDKTAEMADDELLEALEGGER